jgi:hypothetical protein
MDFARVYALVAGFLEAREARVAVVGGLGLHGHGVTRATLDLDLVSEASSQGPLVAFLESQGYETLHRSAGYSNHLHADPDLGRLDLVYLDADTARLLFAGCTARLELGSLRALVPRAEHLAAMKVQAMKNDPSRELQDLADVQALLRLPGVDAAEVRGYFERARLLDRYDAIRRSL